MLTNRDWRDSTARVYDMSADDLGKYIIGRSIVKVDELANEITLDDGTVLWFRDSVDCRDWSAVDLKAGDLINNAITSLNITMRDGTEDYTIHILSEDSNVADLTITDDATDNYDFRSITLEIYVVE